LAFVYFQSVGQFQDLAPEDTFKTRKIGGVNFHIGKGVFVKTYKWEKNDYVQIREYFDKLRPNLRRGINLPIDVLPKLKAAVDGALADFESAPNIY